MTAKSSEIPDSTAVRVALWRAMHVQIDAAPHVLDDEIGLKLVSPPEGWRERPDMHPQGTAPFRASIVARARFIEDLVAEQVNHGVTQYVILGAGLDTFAQRRPEVASKIKVFEIDKPDTQAWKRQRLIETGYPIPEWLRFVPVDFELGDSWWDRLIAAGFDPKKPAIVTSIGVSMYLTMDAIKDTLRQMMKLAPGSKFIMTFMLPLDLVASEDRFGYERSMKGAQMSGTPFISFFSPEEMLKLARSIGFQKVEHLSTADMVPRYFANRSDGLKPSTGEELLIATI
ncbi:class I SAM-dependent methyltransferase [Bdellovibrio sp. BCCA]|uniref:class I SAM-dependent methyltransferase n=1 Tax=Bdellovibrio sp. BCCA TaxID=3136281 RepID=UPI0030F00EFE